MKENSEEEDIKIIEKYLSHFKKVCSPEMLKKDEIIKVIQYKEIQALQHILSNYKRVLKENNRLEEQVEYDKTHIYTPQTIELNFISKSKIKDKIEEIDKKVEDYQCVESRINLYQRKVLQELLEESEE